jgi:hypothetical protein
MLGAVGAPSGDLKDFVYSRKFRPVWTDFFETYVYSLEIR